MQLSFPGPTVAESARAAEIQEKQLALEQGRQELLRKQQTEQEDDRWFKGQLQILNMAEMPTPARLQAGNAILQKMKMPVQLTEDMLNPFNAVMKQYTALSQKGGDTSVLQPVIEVLLKSGQVAPSQVPQAVGTLESINTQAAERTAGQALQPEMERVTTAKNWLQENQQRVQIARQRLQPGASVTADMSRDEAAQLDTQARQYEATIGMEQAFEQRRSRYVQAFKNPSFRKQFQQQGVARELKIGSSLDDVRWRVLDMDANGGPQNENEERFYQSATAMLGFSRPSQAEQTLKEREAIYDLQSKASKTATQLVTAQPYMQPVLELQGTLQKARANRKLKATPDEASKYMQEEGVLGQQIQGAMDQASKEAEGSIQVFQSSLDQTQQQIVQLQERMKRVPTAQGILLKQDLMQLQEDAKFYNTMMTGYVANHPAKQASVRYQLENLEQDLKDTNAPDYADTKKRAGALRTQLGTMEREWDALSHQVAAHDVAVSKRGESLSLQRGKYAKEQDVKKATNDLAAYVMDHISEGYTTALSAGRKLYPVADLGEADKMVKSIRAEAGATAQFDAEAMYLARREANPKESEESSLAYVAKAVKAKGQVVDMKKVREASKKDSLVNINMGSELDKGIAKNLEESQSAAEGAVSTVDAANRIEQALSTGKVTLGPTATIRNQINQFSQILGVGGRDTAEQLVNTRGVIRGLAQFALGARKQLKGQGQVSDYEGRLIERAEAGQIDDFTMPELTSFVGVTKRLATQQHTNHQRKVERLRTLPGGSDRAAFYEVPALPQSAPAKGFSITPKDGFSIKKVN